MTKWRFRAKALPYDYNALEPIISERTLKFHHDKHYVGYVNKLQDLIFNTPAEELSLHQIVMSSQGAIFNNAAQALNHELYFEQLAAHPQREPEGVLLKAIEAEFGSFDNLKERMNQAGLSLFGSGWVWLIRDKDNRLSIAATSNALTPIKEDAKIVLVIDVWEHAYYLDYQNNRAEYLNSFWSAVDWMAIQKRWADIPIVEAEAAPQP